MERFFIEINIHNVQIFDAGEFVCEIKQVILVCSVCKETMLNSVLNCSISYHVCLLCNINDHKDAVAFCRPENVPKRSGIRFPR